jgi:hypothetical protein
MHFSTRIAAAILLGVLRAFAATPEQQFVTNPAGTSAVAIARFNGPDTDVTIPSVIGGKTVVGIGATAFLGANITSVTIPNSVTNIDSHAFASCLSLTNVTLSTNLLSIGQQAFSECPSLRAFAIPASVLDAGNLTFWHDTFLARIDVGAENPNYRSVDGVLFDKSQTTLLTYPPAHGPSFNIPDGTIAIDNYALSDAASLTNISIPASVTTIGWEAFQNTGLTQIVIPDTVKTLGNLAFSGCTNLGGAVIGNGITNIDFGTFSGCLNLTNVSIPAGVVEIGNSAFASCVRLPAITLPDHLASLGFDAFGACSNLTSIKIPDPVVTASDRTFENCASLTNVTIGSGLTYLTTAMFAGCSSLTNITIPATINEIEAAAFASCSNLASVYFQGDAPYLPDDRVFTDSPKTVVYYLPGKNWPAQFAGLSPVLWNPEALIHINVFGVKNGEFTIPIMGANGITIVIEFTTSLTSPVWEPLQTVTLNGDPFLFVDHTSQGQPARFYRFRSP